MENKITKIINENKELYIYWALTDFCNQDCVYCPIKYKSKFYYNRGTPSHEDISIFLKKLITLNKKIKISISGGEPTIHPDLPFILDTLKPHSTVEIATNGSRSITWWETLKNLPNRVIISLHPEYYSNIKNKIFDLTNFLLRNNIDFHFNLMCYPMHWDKVIDIIDTLESMKIKIIAKIVVGGNGHPLREYTSEQLEFIKSHQTDIQPLMNSPVKAYYADGKEEYINPNKIIAENLTNFYQWKCSAGVNGLYIDTAGRINAGICSAKILGNLRNFNFTNEYISCPFTICSCPGDVILEKYDPTIF